MLIQLRIEHTFSGCAEYITESIYKKARAVVITFSFCTMTVVPNILGVSLGMVKEQDDVHTFVPSPRSLVEVSKKTCILQVTKRPLVRIVATHEHD